MFHNKRAAFLVLGLVAILIIWLGIRPASVSAQSILGFTPTPTDTPTETVEIPTETPTPTVETPTPTPTDPVGGPLDTPTPTPTDTPEEDPDPTPTPTPVRLLPITGEGPLGPSGVDMNLLALLAVLFIAVMAGLVLGASLGAGMRSKLVNREVRAAGFFSFWRRSD
jgi:hypothetical protein